MNSRTLSLLTIVLFCFIITCQDVKKENKDNSNITAIEKMLIRADSLELDTPYKSPPGDTLSLHASGFAKILCSAVFITGLDFDFAVENIGYFTAPYHIRSYLTDRKLDMENKAVHITLPNGVVRTAKYYGDQGCICLPENEDELNFSPVNVQSTLPVYQTPINWTENNFQISRV